MGFLAQEDSKDGAHSAVSQGEGYSVFPPNTLFRLRTVHEAGTWTAPGGVHPKQRLLVVSATYKSASKSTGDSVVGAAGGKLCSTLSYGTRESFIDGLEDVVQLQLLCARTTRRPAGPMISRPFPAPAQRLTSHGPSSRDHSHCTQRARDGS